MKNSKRIYYFSHLIILLTGFLFLLNLVIGNSIREYFVIIPDLVLYNNQWWRIITFPFIIHSIENALLFLITFMIFAPKLEEIFRSYLFPTLFFSFIILQGFVLTAIFADSNFQISGISGITFFVLTNFTLMNINKRLMILNRYTLPTSLFVSGLVLVWFFSVFAHDLLIPSANYFFQNISSAIFGFTVGFLTYLQLKMTKNPFKKKLPNNFSKTPSFSKPEEFAFALIANKEKKKFNHTLSEDFDDIKYGMKDFTDDNKLDQILDKINSAGLESLTLNEFQFLKNYSKNL